MSKSKTTGGVEQRLLDNRSEKVMQSKHKPYGLYERCIKRLLDIICSIFAIVIFWWLYLIIALLIRILLGAPVLFVQKRLGKDEKIFKLYKFRSMTNAEDENGKPLSDEMRLTKFGKVLRATSLDELPEVINILKGDMSMVGPRPLLVKYLPRYNAEQRRRHEVRPGLTGLAQTNGRNAISWEERFMLDLKYVGHITFWEDMGIIFKTIKTTLKREGIHSGTAATMEEFVGNKHS